MRILALIFLSLSFLFSYTNQREEQTRLEKEIQRLETRLSDLKNHNEFLRLSIHDLIEQDSKREENLFRIKLNIPRKRSIRPILIPKPRLDRKIDHLEIPKTQIIIRPHFIEPDSSSPVPEALKKKSRREKKRIKDLY